MLSVTIETPGGEPLTTVDFGTVLPGQVSADVPFRVRNDGDNDLSAPRAWVEQVNVADGEMQVVLGGVVLTGVPQVLPALAVGATLSGTMRWRTPPDASGLPVDTADLRVEPI